MKQRERERERERQTDRQTDRQTESRKCVSQRGREEVRDRRETGTKTAVKEPKNSQSS